jgi:hypothetical protein
MKLDLAGKILSIIFLGLLVFSFLFLHFTPLLAQGLYNPGGWNCTQISSNTWSCSGVCNGNSITDCRVGWLNNNPSCACCGDCQLDDALRVWVNIAKIILRFMGVIALVVLIYGGIMWITSGGSPEKIKVGKSAIGGAVAGILVIVFAYVLVYNLMTILGVQSQYLPSAEAPSQCAAYYGSQGYRCTNVDECSPPIQRGLCPDGEDNVCCVPMNETQCVRQYGSNGYACRDTSECVTETIKTGLCPGGANIVCCQFEEH